MMNRRGVTLLEILVVLVLTGLMFKLAWPKIDVTRYKADAVVTGVRSSMQQAQRASLVAQHDIIVSFDLTGGRVRIAWDADNDHLIGQTERVIWNPLLSGNRFAIPATGVKGSSVSAAIVGSQVRMMDNMPTVTFHRDGSLSSELEIYMSTTGHPTLWRAVTVVQATGRTDWFRQGSGKWVPGVL